MMGRRRCCRPLALPVKRACVFIGSVILQMCVWWLSRVRAPSLFAFVPFSVYHPLFSLRVTIVYDIREPACVPLYHACTLAEALVAGFSGRPSRTVNVYISHPP